MSKALGALQQLRGLVTAASPSRCVLDVAGGLDRLLPSVEHESDRCTVPLCAAAAAHPAAARHTTLGLDTTCSPRRGSVLELPPRRALLYVPGGCQCHPWSPGIRSRKRMAPLLSSSIRTSKRGSMAGRPCNASYSTHFHTQMLFTPRRL